MDSVDFQLKKAVETSIAPVPTKPNLFRMKHLNSKNRCSRMFELRRKGVPGPARGPATGG